MTALEGVLISAYDAVTAVERTYHHGFVGKALTDLSNLVDPEGGWLAEMAQERLQSSTKRLPSVISTALKESETYQALIESMKTSPLVAIDYLMALDLEKWYEQYRPDGSLEFDPVPFALQNLIAVERSLHKHTYP